ncbi:Putative protein [Zobellia galactanivorans]|uniref:Uncharacterized protein n=1 Tax=Zobellia galactanivorans (strain DSM 12802 / CCUG 47099 / CIP 106680 / NCIMB 13871 / Dsij) TaxID=63186 RepID=G0L4G8_ZOBGA|nr:Putative protein [Zobellia galactanivorans]
MYITDVSVTRSNKISTHKASRTSKTICALLIWGASLTKKCF